MGKIPGFGLNPKIHQTTNFGVSWKINFRNRRFIRIVIYLKSITNTFKTFWNTLKTLGIWKPVSRWCHLDSDPIQASLDYIFFGDHLEFECQKNRSNSVYFYLKLMTNKFKYYWNPKTGRSRILTSTNHSLITQFFFFNWKISWDWVSKKLILWGLFFSGNYLQTHHKAFGI